MRTRWAIAVVVLQVLVLAYMAGERELVLQRGKSMWLRTAPIDPRDPMRGDYVRFDYEIGHVPQSLCRDGVREWFESDGWKNRQVRDRRVYATVTTDEEGVVQLVSLSDRRPASGDFLRGRANGIESRQLRVRFGVEALFMEQGQAKALETEQSRRAGVPLNIEVAVSDGGLAVMRGYRWEPLGITLRFDRPEREPAGGANLAQPRAGLRGATVTLKNHSDAPVAIVVRPNGQSFELVPQDMGMPSTFVWGAASAMVSDPTAAMIKVLQPGEDYAEHLDFRDRRWWVTETKENAPPGAAVSLESLDQVWGAWFRLEYVPPTRAAVAGMPNAELVRHSRLKSRRFSPAGGID